MNRETKTVIRPWGSFQQYYHTDIMTVNMLCVNPRQRLSLQSHKERSELWIIMDEGIQVQIGNTIYYPDKNDEMWIPVGEKHRLSSINDKDIVRVMEIAYGNWKQDDITRYADDYNRPDQGELPKFPIGIRVYDGDLLKKCHLCGSSMARRFKWFPFFFTKSTCIHPKCSNYDKQWYF